MSRIYTKPDGTQITIECVSCAVAEKVVIPEFGFIYEGNHFNLHQDMAYPVPGQIIIAANRHFTSLDKMNDEEYQEFNFLLMKARKSQREVLEIKHTYYYYNEDTTHHFHIWLVPRYQWMYEFGRSIESVRPALLHARESMRTEENLKMVESAVLKLKDYFSHY